MPRTTRKAPRDGANRPGVWPNLYGRIDMHKYHSPPDRLLTHMRPEMIAPPRVLLGLVGALVVSAALWLVPIAIVVGWRL